MSITRFSNLKTKLSTPKVGYVIIVIAACFTGLIHSMTKPLLSIANPSGMILDPLVFVAIIYLINGAFFTPVKKEGVPLRRMQRRDILIIVAIGVAEVSGLTAYFFGLKQTTAVNASILTNGEIAFVVLIALTIFRERLHKMEILPFSAIIAGIIILPVFFEIFQSKLMPSNLMYGNLLVLLSGVFYAIDVTLCKYVTNVDPKRITQLVSFTGAGVALFMIMMLQIPFKVDLIQLPSIIFLGFFGTGMATFLFLSSLKMIGTTRTILLYSTNFVFGVIFAMIFLHETITVINLASIALASIGMYLLRNRLASNE